MKNKITNLSRRSFLKIAGISALALSTYSLFRGLRFPVLSWEPSNLETKILLHDVEFFFNDLIYSSNNNSSLIFRAYAPEPKIRIHSKLNRTIEIIVNNISPDAALDFGNSDDIHVSEQIDGITRKLTLSLTAETAINLQWTLPDLDTYSFAAIGDTGGDKELGWCIQRAHSLGARFLLHLGDFNYQGGDYDNAITQFNQAPLPCYISIGNHDFNESGLVYQQFLKEIGPLNNFFSIGKTRFINIDTAASFFPYSSGLRGKLMQQLVDDKTVYTDNVVFTHRPLHDPQPQEVRDENGDHDLGSEGETDWLISSLKKINANTLLSGHIHIFDRSTYRGIDNIIVGQGLGHQDLLVNNNEISKIAIGTVNKNGKVSYDFAALEMPMELHCHPRVQVVKDSISNQPHAQTINKIDAACNQDG